MAWRWVIALAAADLIVFAITLHAHLSFHDAGGPNSPSVMSVGQLLGWFFTVALFCALLAVVAGSRQAMKYRGDPHRR
jgi:hypothetical protein